MSNSKADFIVVPVGTPMPRKDVEARAARLREIIPQYEAMVDSAKHTRGDDEVSKLRGKIKQFKARLEELDNLLKSGSN